MPFEPATLAQVEDALAECFAFHNALDTFLVRVGAADALATARKSADARLGAQAHPKFPKAPKRYVAQELVAELGRRDEAGDQLVAAIITALIKGNFPEASAKGKAAVSALRVQIEADKALKRSTAEDRKEEQRERELAADREAEARRAERDRKRDDLRARFLALSIHPDPKVRGYDFEKFLVRLFELEQLQPRGSFKIVGEQIDGSFMWGNQTHLLEAKWVSAPVAGADFGAFIYKIDGKAADTRGLFVSINGYSEEAIAGLNGKGVLRFVCIDGAHLLRAFDPGWSLTKVLETVWRHAGETGCAYFPVGAFKV